MSKMIENERETIASKRILQVERGEVLYREDIKTSYAYALVGLTTLVIVTGVVLGVAGMGYSFIQQMKK